MKNYIRLMRPHHCIKNVLIFLPLIFSGRFFEFDLLISTICGFVLFSLVSSIIYVINDIADCEKDRLHSTKCMRPIASGAISIKSAWFFASALFAVSAALYIAVYYSKPCFSYAWIIIFIYILLNFTYSFALKNVPLLDIAILVSGFILRLLFGSSITGIEISNWMYLTITSLSFYLGLGKRRNELITQKDGTRKVLKYYTKDFLDKNMYLSLALAITFYSLWCVNSQASGNLVWTVPFVILICMKYSLNIEGNSSGDPVEVILHDKILLALIAAFAVTTMCILYI